MDDLNATIPHEPMWVKEDVGCQVNRRDQFGEGFLCG